LLLRRRRHGDPLLSFLSSFPLFRRRLGEVVVTWDFPV
jgi:hypothetical protein